jgi:hypothetical protein
MRQYKKLSKFIILISLLMVLFSASSTFAKVTDPPPPPDMSDSQFNPDLGDDWDDDPNISGKEARGALYYFLKCVVHWGFVLV